MKIKKKIFPDKPLQAERPKFPDHFAALVTIGVVPGFQGQGFGSLLLQEFQNKTMELGFNMMRLSVSSQNLKAIKSYERDGWMKIQSTENSFVMEKVI